MTKPLYDDDDDEDNLDLDDDCQTEISRLFYDTKYEDLQDLLGGYKK